MCYDMTPPDIRYDGGYILIDSKTRAPVPLPFETTALNGDPITVVGFSNDSIMVSCRRVTSLGVRRYQAPARLLGLALITEADFMAERNS